MKILYIAPSSDDFLSNSVFHGLRSLFGEDVIDVEPQLLLYKSASPESVKRMHGRGHTLSRTLDDIEIDRTDIPAKIMSQYFDLIVFGVVNNASLRYDSLSIINPQTVTEYNPKKNIVFLDGADSPDIKENIRNRGWYFKRELFLRDSGLKPIGFSVPKEKIRDPSMVKTRLIAPLVPGVGSTFIYDSETDYYDMYANSLFGLTWKKAGWDCLRHYEILAAGCMPLFVDIHHCPNTILVTYPKQLVKDVFNLNGLELPFSPTDRFEYTNLFISNVDFSKINYAPTLSSLTEYATLLEKLHIHTRTYLTTENTAKYIIDVVQA